MTADQDDHSARDNKVSQDDVEELALKAKPGPVSRINRRVLFGAVGVLLAVLAGTVLVALDPPRFDSEPERQTIPITRRPPDGLEKLPKSYDQIPTAKPRLVQKTAPPKPQPPSTPNPIAPLAPNAPSNDARQLLAALKSPIQFRLSQSAQPAPARPIREPIRAPNSQPSAGNSSTGYRIPIAGAGSEQPNNGANDQTQKQAFVSTTPTSNSINKHPLRQLSSPYTLLAGTVISASLITGLNSDLPGFVIAQVTENVYDTVTGRHLLIPQGARLVGKYDSKISYGQDRALVVWQRILLPNGNSIQIENLPATDPAGFAGLKDRVDQHIWQLVRGIALATVLGISSELAFENSDNDELIRALQQATGQTTNRAGQRLVERQLSRQPTLKVRPGWPLRVIVHKDLVLSPYLPAR